MSGVLEITTKVGCKVNCKFCPQALLINRYYKEMDKQEKYMSFETFKTCLDKVPKDVKIDFAGMCEPWLNPECSKMLLYAVEQGYKVGIFTTLVGMQEKDLDIIEKLDINQLVIHIPDTSNNTNIVIDENYKTLLKRAVELKGVINKSFSCHGAVHQDIESVVDRSWIISSELIDRAGHIEDENVKHQNKLGKIICGLNGKKLNNNILLPDGSVLLCCMDYGMDHVLGNLLHNSYEELFNGEEALRIIKGMENEQIPLLCRKCSNAIESDELEEAFIESKKNNQELWDSNSWLQTQLKNEQFVNQELNEAKEFYINQVENYKKEITNNEAVVKELQEAKKFFIDQVENYKKEMTNKEKVIDQLSEAKSFYINQIENYKNELSSYEKVISELNEAKQYFIQQLENYRVDLQNKENVIKEINEAKEYHISQVESHKNEINKKEELLSHLEEENNAYKIKNEEQEDTIKNLEAKANFLSKELQKEIKKPWYKKIFK